LPHLVWLIFVLIRFVKYIYITSEYRQYKCLYNHLSRCINKPPIFKGVIHLYFHTNNPPVTLNKRSALISCAALFSSIDVFQIELVHKLVTRLRESAV
jgi:hypothetical protein